MVVVVVVIGETGEDWCWCRDIPKMLFTAFLRGLCVFDGCFDGGILTHGGAFMLHVVMSTDFMIVAGMVPGMAIIETIMVMVGGLVGDIGEGALHLIGTVVVGAG